MANPNKIEAAARAAYEAGAVYTRWRTEGNVDPSSWSVADEGSKYFCREAAAHVAKGGSLPVTPMEVDEGEEPDPPGRDDVLYEDVIQAVFKALGGIDG